MLDLSRARNFQLRQGGVWCDREGLFVGSTPLLVAKRDSSKAAIWLVRPESELNGELSACYGLPPISF